MNEPNTQLTLERRQELAKVDAAPSVANMLQAVIEQGITTENVAAFRELIELHERVESRTAEKDFTLAFKALQTEAKKVQATQGVPGKDGQIKYNFAPFESIMDQVQPLLDKHDFAVSFSTRIDGDRVVAICKLRHVSGCKEESEFAARIGSGPPNASAAQADGAASTYAKRFALCNALNIVISKMDDDARSLGDTIDAATAKILRDRVRACQANEQKFLKFANANSFEEIMTSRLDSIEEMLQKKEREFGKF